MASFDTQLTVRLNFTPTIGHGIRHWLAVRLMRLACRIYSGKIGDIEVGS
jgi:hypothetical protein